MSRAGRPNERKAAVLIVDDDPEVLRTTVAILSDRYAVTGTTDPRDALSLLARQRYEVVIADWQMPTMDGLAFFDAVSKMPIRVSCLLISAHVEELIAAVARNQRRFLGFIAKPVEPERLLERVEHFARLASMKESVFSLAGVGDKESS
jgi:DNA-binding NtrC family response regulator